MSSYDAYPPGDVRDLSVTLVNDTVTNVTVELKWTAPGDELDTGTGKYMNVVILVMQSIISFDLLTCSFSLRAEVFRNCGRRDQLQL